MNVSDEEVFECIKNTRPDLIEKIPEMNNKNNTLGDESINKLLKETNKELKKQIDEFNARPKEVKIQNNTDSDLTVKLFLTDDNKLLIDISKQEKVNIIEEAFLNISQIKPGDTLTGNFVMKECENSR